ncbi:hypothetical protein ACFL4C_03470 [Candidatus Omnitrophota bacterium]
MDTTSPVISCPVDVTIECDESSDPSNAGSATATDNCGTPTITYSDVDYLTDCNGTGYVDRTWTATDDCGNSSSCVQVITVVDTTSPLIVCPPGLRIKIGDSRHPDDTGYATATDNCGTPTVTYSDLEFLTSGAGHIERIWTATDDCGNSSRCGQIISVGPFYVGGEVHPVNKVTLIIPWIILSVAIVAAGIVLVSRRYFSSK